MLILSGLLALGACALRLLIGPEGLGWPPEALVWELRTLRVIGGAAVGASLAIGGVLLQCLLRNPLASPDVLGVSSGASLGVVVAVFVAGGGASAAAWQVVPALLGAGGALMLVLGLSGGARAGDGGVEGDRAGLIVTGVVVSVLCGAGVMFFQHLMPDAGYATTRLLMGGLHDDTAAPVTMGVLALALIGAGVATWLGPALDALRLSADEALSVGVPVARMRRGALVLTGVLAAGAVVVAGPVGFVGLMAPHVASLMLGVREGRHRLLVPVAGLMGVAIVVGADGLIRAVNLGAGRMPLGVLTALLGAPTLLALLRGAKERA
jgi:iron complex transport system permease protein